MPVSDVAANAPATSAWANSVSDAIQEIEADLYPGTYGQVSIPWSAITGEPAVYPPELAVAVTGSTVYSQAPAVGAAVVAAKGDHVHGTPPLPTPAQVGSVAAYDTPATVDGGKRLYVGTSAPTGPSEGDVWIKG